jgi:hypothetical protein
MNGEPAKLTTVRGDREIAEDLKRRLIAALEPVLAISNEAVAQEFNVALNYGRDQYGRLTLTPVLMRQF